MEASRRQAFFQAKAIAGENSVDQGGTTVVHANTLSLPYVVIDPEGTPVLQGAPLKGQTLHREQLTPAPSEALPSWSVEREVRLDPRPARAKNRYSGRTFTAVGVWSYVPEPDPKRGSTYFTAGAGQYTVYVLVTPFEAEDTVADIDPALCAGVPGAAFLVAAFVWLTTGSALRPVEAIRAELAEIGEQGLDRRVPVPRGRDEIHRMAVTTNDTLDRLQRSAEEQSRFVADASHELRSPLAALRTTLEVSLAHQESTDWPRATATAVESVRRLQQLTDDLLFLARPDGPARDAERFDLADTVRDLVTELRHLHADRAELASSLPGTAAVHGHPLQLRRLLRNLVDNAVRHARTAITVTMTADGETVRVEVHNDGSDIAPADRERIFERFTRLDESRSRDAGGSGLGLAIAREIAVRHGGTLTVADTPPGTGATFVLEVPTGETPS
ncbi:sensor histidine kinase [Streptomyces gamaensis]|uniref:histidine kinase n=2 Tax=Streptomyces gamaensis TaxID=1763542 RepID=A0ABW0Z4T7_9ACTN